MQRKHKTPHTGTISSKEHKGKGSAAEKLAECYLKTQGLIFLERNFLCKSGEIDLICRDGDTIVFVEVRLRSGRSRGSAAESITFKKQKRILKTALYWLNIKKLHSSSIRFDAVLFEGALAPDNISWLKSIF